MTFLNEKPESNFLFNALAETGIEFIFGSEEESLLQPMETSNIRYFQLKHEQAAVHAADGFSRTTGRSGVVLLTTAPGIINGVMGIAAAFKDSVPLVVIAGPLGINSRNDVFLDFGIAELLHPITKHVFHIKYETEFPSVVPEALNMAASGRPGPAVIYYSPDPVHLQQTNRLGHRLFEARPSRNWLANLN